MQETVNRHFNYSKGPSDDLITLPVQFICFLMVKNIKIELIMSTVRSVLTFSFSLRKENMHFLILPPIFLTDAKCMGG